MALLQPGQSVNWTRYDLEKMTVHEGFCRYVLEQCGHTTSTIGGRGKPVHCPPDTFGLIGKRGLNEGP